MTIPNKKPFPTYTIKANPFKLLLFFSTIITIQIGCFKFIESSDYITFGFIFAVLGLIFFFCFGLYLFYLLIRYGRPRVCFMPEYCRIQMYTVHISIPYKQISSINFNKVEQEHRGIKWGHDYQLTLYLKDEIAQTNMFRRKTFQVKDQVIASQFIFRNQKILEMAIIFTAIARMTPKKRIETIQQLSDRSSHYDHLISNKELENFKNNQYISKYFKSGQ